MLSLHPHKKLIHESLIILRKSLPLISKQVLGTPTREEISAMNSNYTEFKFPQIKACQWRKVFRSKTPEDAMDFIGSTLAYAPDRRIKPLEGCGHSFFDELRDERTRLPNGNPLPPLFDFTPNELSSSPDLLAKVSWNFHYSFWAAWDTFHD